MIPRIKGKIGQYEQPLELKDKYCFEIFISELGGGEGESMGVFGPFESKDVASKELKNVVKVIVDTYEKSMNGVVSRNYIDMKDNKIKQWVVE